jgi:glycogen debranching enzyme
LNISNNKERLVNGSSHQTAAVSYNHSKTSTTLFLSTVCYNATVDQLKEKTKQMLEANRREKDGFQYTVPSPNSYPYQWFWDSCFHAIILTHFDIEAAKNELRSLVSKQTEDGFMPHIIYWEKHPVLPVDWGMEGTSSLIQPPIIAYALLRIYQADHDKAFLREIYAHLNPYYRYLLKRDPRENHLVGIINPDESGEDDSPRFDPPMDMPPVHDVRDHVRRRQELFEKNRQCHFETNTCMRNFFWVKDVAFNSYLVENLDAMRDIAQTLGEDGDAYYFDRHCGFVKAAMRRCMYEDGIFWTTYGLAYHKVETRTWAMFAPMVANMVTREEAENLVHNYLKNEHEFNSPYPLPTVSMSEPSYRPEESTWGEAWEHPNWRGPVWFASNWFVYRGLKKYGYHDEAELIKRKSIELIETSGFREYFHPETGAGMGAENFTWGGLVIDMN